MYVIFATLFATFQRFLLKDALLHEIMCCPLRKEVRGWCESFTTTELCLCILEVMLLAVIIGTLTFLSIHLFVCAHDFTISYNENQNITTAGSVTTKKHKTSTFGIKNATRPYNVTTVSTMSPNVECTWERSKKSEATTHYYLNESIKYPTYSTEATSTQQSNSISNSISDDMNSDGKDAPPKYKDVIAALVKWSPPADVTFGCILTKITPYWALTAASCIESVEEVDSLDSFFIMDGLGEILAGSNHALADVQIHPLYQGANRSFDLAALRSEDALASNSAHFLTLPTMMEYFLLTVGEKFIILGYGRYRRVESGAAARRLRVVEVHSVSVSQCSEPEAWSLRHLSGGAGLRAGVCGAGALCAGPLAARSAPCSYCAGTPLLRAGRLYGLMSDNAQCGLACEPRLYVNVAALADWIRSFI